MQSIIEALSSIKYCYFDAMQCNAMRYKQTQDVSVKRFDEAFE